MAGGTGATFPGHAAASYGLNGGGGAAAAGAPARASEVTPPTGAEDMVGTAATGVSLQGGGEDPVRPYSGLCDRQGRRRR